MKECISTDISKDELVCRFGWQDADQKICFGSKATFGNTPSGIRKLYSWALKLHSRDKECVFVMEATGVYHEHLAYFLHEKGERVCVVLPARAKKYAESLGRKSKTDPADADMLCHMGLERRMDLWSPPNPVYRTLRSLTREMVGVKDGQTRISNQIHALQSSRNPEKSVVSRLKKKLAFEKKLEKEILLEIKKVLEEHPELNETVQRLTTIRGAALKTVVTVIAETDGFALIKNCRQLASYAGLDVRQEESGTFKAKSRISKRGNTYLRKALFMPAMSAVRVNPPIKELHQRIKARTSIPKKGIIAAARKLLLLIYALWKNGQSFELRPAPRPVPSNN